jgi:hypothetical protein
MKKLSKEGMPQIYQRKPLPCRGSHRGLAEVSSVASGVDLAMNPPHEPYAHPSGMSTPLYDMNPPEEYANDRLFSTAS